MSPGNDLLPHNITLSSQTATIMYSPYRDGDCQTGWNVSYTYGVQDHGYGIPQGIGTDYHRTYHGGASLQFNWTGTAVYLYGNASMNTYSIVVDGTNEVVTFDVPQGGLLGKKEGLDYGDHTAKLTVHGNGTKEVAFQYAQVTVGLGYGSKIQNTTINAVDEKSSNNLTVADFFHYKGPVDGWSVEDLAKGNSSPVDNFPKIFRPNGSITNLPHQMITSDGGDVVSFKITNASAFIVWGTVNQNHGSKSVKFTGPNVTKWTILEDSSSALDFWQILYWESGLDRNETYTVSVMNRNNSKLAFSAVKIIDGGARISTISGLSTGLKAGVIAAIDIGSMGFLALLAIIGLVYWRRHTKANRPPLLHRLRISISDLGPIEFAPVTSIHSNTSSNRSSRASRVSDKRYSTDSG
ncbi:hypothetical protein E1B28_007707 [Marasmius oreades]|uniref:Uncharacterized protein n=1 Tax=Marasmius oreades TaxID=181124 RepID=A0A9P7S2Q5_9AGAR|nr:uncharacterized protein E1B28_007707 [Marasmius oreades]KAG7094088.1 hypothetical protein E1B28_007707 [Marasmius oreades]